MTIRWDDDPLCGAFGCYSNEPRFITSAFGFGGGGNPCINPGGGARGGARGGSPDDGPLEATLRGDVCDLRERMGDGHPGVHYALNDAARICAEAGDAGAALEFYSEALALQQYTLGVHHPHNGDTLCAMAVVMKGNGSLNQSADIFSDALYIYKEALQNERSALGIRTDYSPGFWKMLDLELKISNTLNSIGNVRFEQHQFDEATEVYNKGLKMVRVAAKKAESVLSSTGEAIEVQAASGSTNVEVIEFVVNQDDVAIEVSSPIDGNLGNSRQTHPERPGIGGPGEKIKRLYRRAVLQEADTLNNLANLHGEREEWAEAIRHYNFALHLQMEHLGEDDPVVANTLFNLGTMNYRLGNLANAMKSYKQVAKMRRDTIGPGIDLSDAVINVAMMQAKLGLVDKAEKMYSYALRLAINDVGEQHFKVAHITAARGDFFLEHRKDDQCALQDYADSWTILKFNNVPDDHSLIQAVTRKIVDLKFKEYGEIGGAMSALYEVMQAVGVDAMAAMGGLDGVGSDLKVRSFVDDLSRANVDLAAY